MEKFTIVLEKQENGFSACNPKFGNIIEKGNTEQEAINNLKKAIENWLKKDPRRKEWLKEFYEIKDNVRMRIIKR